MRGPRRETQDHQSNDRLFSVTPATAPPGHKHRTAPPVGSAGNTTALRYHSGQVINTPTIYIWYGDWNQTKSVPRQPGASRSFAIGHRISATRIILRINATVFAKPVSGTAFYGGEYTYAGGRFHHELIRLQHSLDCERYGQAAYNASGVSRRHILERPMQREDFVRSTRRTAGSAKHGDSVRYAFVGNAARCIQLVRSSRRARTVMREWTARSR